MTSGLDCLQNANCLAGSAENGPPPPVVFRSED